MTRLGFVARLSLAILCVLALQVGGAPAIAYRTTVAWPPYHWPIRPFDSMHPVRAAFGDPRTLAENEPFGMTGPGVPGAHSFHNGIDIAARPGTAVYPVVSGGVVTRGRNEIIVLTDDGRSFQYEHLKRVVHQGQLVVAQRTVLGWIQPEPATSTWPRSTTAACRIHSPPATSSPTATRQDRGPPLCTSTMAGLDRSSGGVWAPATGLL